MIVNKANVDEIYLSTKLSMKLFVNEASCRPSDVDETSFRSYECRRNECDLALNMSLHTLHGSIHLCKYSDLFSCNHKDVYSYNSCYSCISGFTLRNFNFVFLNFVNRLNVEKPRDLTIFLEEQ